MESGVQFDREKMRAVILRACHACTPNELGAVKLHKVLYFLDMISYAHHRLSVTGSTYRKRPFGPTADQLLPMLREMSRSGEIEIKDVGYHGFFKKEYHAKVPMTSAVLNDQEISLLDDVLEFVCKSNTAKEISEYSHKEPWEMAQSGGVIEYHTALMLFPSQPSPEAFDVAIQGMNEIEEARSSGNAVGMSKLGDFRSRLLEATGQH